MRDDSNYQRQQMVGHQISAGARLINKKLSVSVNRLIGSKGATIEFHDGIVLEPDEARELARWLIEAAAEVDKVTR